jgi:C-terminal processing protease CtpA/Prc
MLLAQPAVPSAADPSRATAPLPDVAVTAAEARSTADDLARKLDEIYVFPDVAKRYSAMLRTNAASGAYDGFTSGRAFAERLSEDLNAVSPDRHLRVTIRKPQSPARNATEAKLAPRQTFPWKPIEEQRWLTPGIAYIRFNLFPGDEATVEAVKTFMTEHAAAKVIIFDNRTHHGGGLDEMNAMFPFLFAKPTTLVVMDTRESNFDGQDEPSLRRVPGPGGIVRHEHFVVPSTTEERLFDAKIFVLTSGRTGSAAEHMTLALKRTGRATIIGEPTTGAGHYGGIRPIGEKFDVFIPEGRTFDPDTGKDWEGTGVSPDAAVAADKALTEALVRSGLERLEAERISATVKPSGPMTRPVRRPAG